MSNITITKEVLSEMIELFYSARDEWKNKRGQDKEYWQGRKDGIRLMLSFLDLDGSWEMENLSSPGYQSTDKEKILALIKSARYNSGEFIYNVKSGEKNSKFLETNYREFVAWVDWYDRQAENGLVEKVTDSLDIGIKRF